MPELQRDGNKTFVTPLVLQASELLFYLCYIINLILLIVYLCCIVLHISVIILILVLFCKEPEGIGTVLAKEPEGMEEI